MTAQELRRHLRRLGMSQMELSRQLKVEPRTVRRWVLGENRVPEAVALLVECWREREPQRRR